MTDKSARGSAAVSRPHGSARPRGCGRGNPRRSRCTVRMPSLERIYDWSAVRDGYDAGDPIGYGKTAEEAIADLKKEESERNDGAES